MNKNLFYKELKRNRKNLIIWALIVVGFTLMVLSIFPFMAEMGQDMTKLMEKMPAEIGKAMGMDAQTWSSILGFYSTYYGVYIVVLISIFTTSTGASIISKEEKDRTAEFLLTRPITRLTIFKSKLAALFLLSIIIYVIQTLTAIIGISIFKTGQVDWTIFTTMHAGGFVLMLFFTTLGVLISMFVTPKKNFMGIVVGLTFGTYFLNAIGNATDSTNWLSYFSPFGYMKFTIDPTYVFNFVGAIALLIVGTVALVFSYKTYLKKDIAG